MRQHGKKGFWFLLAAGLAVSIWSAPAPAQEKYPSKPISLVVSWPAGGRTDIFARLVAPLVEKNLGQPVMVVNKPGASGYIGFKSISTAKPDGYTVGIDGGGLMAVQYTGQGKIRWEEFKWVGQVYAASATVSVNAESPWKTIEEFIDYTRKNPGKVKHANSGHGGTTHLYSEGFAKAAGLKFIQVAYKGDAPAAVALGSKEVDVTCCPISAVRPLMEAGKIRVLAVQSDKRSAQYPNIPTLKERGIDWSVGTFGGFFVPKDTPDSIVSVIEAALEKAMKDRGLAEGFKKIDTDLEWRNSKEFTAHVAKQDKITHDLLKEVGLIK